MVDAAAARGREKPDDEGGDNEAGQGWGDKQAILAAMWGGPQTEQADPIDCNAEGNNERAGDHADEDGEDKEEPFVARGGNSLDGRGKTRARMRFEGKSGRW